MRLLSVIALAVLTPMLASGADLSAEEILQRMRLQAGVRQVVAGTQQGLPARGAGGSEAIGQPASVSAAGKAGVTAVAMRPGRDAGKINLQILFEFDSAKLAPVAVSQLRELCRAFQQTADIHRPFMIIGHTDAVGGEVYNLRLSNARAQEVRRYLVEDCGIDSRRLQAEGRGEEELRPGLSPRDPLQRRVEVKIVG